MFALIGDLREGVRVEKDMSAADILVFHPWYINVSMDRCRYDGKRELHATNDYGCCFTAT
jgi:hypothetical protein